MANINRNFKSTVTARTLNGGIDNVVTTITLDSSAGLPDFPFSLVIEPDVAGKEEIVTATSAGGGANQLVVTRGQDGTSATSHANNVAVRHMITGRDLQDAHDHLTATTNVHGVTGSIAPTASPTFTGLATFSGTVSLPSSSVTNSNLAANAVTSAKIADDTIVNADINSSANIAQSKIANLTTDLAAKAPLAAPALTGTPTLNGTAVKRVVTGSASVIFTSGTGTLSWGTTLPFTPSSFSVIGATSGSAVILNATSGSAPTTTGVALRANTVSAAFAGSITIYWVAFE